MHSNRFSEKVLTFSSYDYCYRISLVSLITMLTFKTVLTILFILDFNRMTSIPEKIVIRFMWMITSIFTLAHLGHEITLRQTLGYHHFGRLCFNLYLGKVCLYADIITTGISFLSQGNIEDSNQSGTGSILYIPLAFLSISLIMCWVIKYHKNKLSIIQNYQNNITDSSANGLTNFSVLMAMFAMVLLCTIGAMGVKVDIFFLLNF